MVTLPPNNWSIPESRRNVPQEYVVELPLVTVFYTWITKTFKAENALRESWLPACNTGVARYDSLAAIMIRASNIFLLIIYQAIVIDCIDPMDDKDTDSASPLTMLHRQVI